MSAGTATAAAAGAVLLVAACGSSSKASTSPAASSSLPSAVKLVGDSGKRWTPATLTVKAGPIDIAVTSTGKTHDLVITGVAGGQAGPIFPGQTVRLKLTVKPGHYTFRCTYHHMMTGTLIAK